MSNADLQAQLAALKSENEALKAAKIKKITFKVGKAGGVSVYGLQRFPVTLYSQQMLRLLDNADGIRAFIKENAGTLAVKENAGTLAVKE